MKPYSEIFSALEFVDEIVYVSDPQTYELVYCNAKARAVLLSEFRPDTPGCKCHKCLQGLDHPCIFCNNDALRICRHSVYTHHNSLLNTDFLLDDRMITVDGRELRLEIAVDLNTVTKEQGTVLDVSAHDYMHDCIRRLVKSDNFAQSVDTVMQTILSFYSGERAYLFEFDWPHDECNNTFEICAKGVTSEIDNLKHVPNDYIRTWVERFRRGENTIIEDLSLLENDPARRAEYDVLQPQGIHSLIVTPIYTDSDSLIGFIGVDNPKENFDKIDFLNNVCYFIGVELNKNKILEELRELNYTDQMTGIGNRNAYSAFMKAHETTAPEHGGVIFLDMNGLKYLNDNFGHEYGDTKLRTIADVLTTFYPPEQVFRISGDEFVIFDLTSDYETFRHQSEALKAELYDHQKGIAAVGAVWEDNGVSLRTLQNQAEQIMYTEKQKYYMNSTDVSTRKVRPEYINDVLASLRADRYLVSLQPKFDLKTRAVTGAEALVRKLDAAGNWVSPREFIPALEKEHAVSFVDFFVFEKVCETIRDWEERLSPDFVISTNFSRYTLALPDFADRVISIAERIGVSPRRIVLEITETTNSLHMQLLSDIMTRLQAKGFRFSLDDFGTEYATLEMLKLSHLGSVKFDISLVRRIQSDPRTKLILKSLVLLSHNLNMECIAEGIETPEQLDTLRDIGCDRGQGYLVDKPLPVEVFREKYIDGGAQA